MDLISLLVGIVVLLLVLGLVMWLLDYLPFDARLKRAIVVVLLLIVILILILSVTGGIPSFNINLR